MDSPTTTTTTTTRLTLDASGAPYCFCGMPADGTGVSVGRESFAVSNGRTSIARSAMREFDRSAAVFAAAAVSNVTMASRVLATIVESRAMRDLIWPQ